MACIKLPVWADIFEGFIGDFSHFLLFFSFSSGIINSFNEPREKDIRRLRKSEIYDNQRFKSLLNSGARRISRRPGYSYSTKFKDTAGDDQLEDQYLGYTCT